MMIEAERTEAYEAFHPQARTACVAVLRRMYASLRLALWSTSELDDAVTSAVDDALLNIFVSWDAFDETRATRITWVVCVAKRRFMRFLSQAYRSAVRRRPQPIETLEIAVADDTRDVLNQQAVDQILSHIAAPQAEALRLHYLDAMPVRQVADVMQTSVAAVQSLLQRGKDAARRRTLEKGDETDDRRAV
jgi:RNA polymerase sigma-70 factor (ECF subfamily)